MRSPFKNGSDFYNPGEDKSPLRLRRFPLKAPQELPRTNYFTIFRILSGSGEAAIDESHLSFSPSDVLFALPYQYVRLSGQAEVEAVEFHANFLCVETFHAEVGCAGRLFNDPYGLPLVSPDPTGNHEVCNLFEQIRQELDEAKLAYQEAALALLKLLLIRLTRLKDAPGTAPSRHAAEPRRPPILIELEELIEARYHTWHTPSDYAHALHISTKTLGRLIRDHLGTTTTNLIRRRILIHAKWQLLHTLKPVKAIASELSYRDELYFSRWFKKATGVSPTYFREFETMIRRGSNLSMLFGNASIAKDQSQV